MKIQSNYHWRPFVYRADVPPAILASEFDWLDAEADDGFFKYRGWWYHVSEFYGTAGLDAFGMAAMDVWDAHYPDSFYSGIVIRFGEDDQYQVGTYYS